MKAIEIRDQVRLPLAKCIELVLTGIRFRLFRAAVTVVIISLATAFLMNMLTESLTSRRVANVIDKATAPRRLLNFWHSSLTVPLVETELTARLAALKEGDGRWQEFKTWGKLDDGQLEDLRGVAARQITYLTYFDELSEGQRRLLVGRMQGTSIFRMLLRSDESFTQFAQAAEKLQKPLPPPPGPSLSPAEAFRKFLGDWKNSGPLRDRIRAGNVAAVNGLKELFGSRSGMQVLASADASLVGDLKKQGFCMSEGELQTVREQAKARLDSEQISDLILIPSLKSQLAARRGARLSQVDVSELLAEASSSDGSKWLIETANKIRREQGQGPLELTPERMQEVARAKIEQTKLSAVEDMVTHQVVGKGLMGFSGRTVWLIIVSFMVCIVGIANAMLMSVTERFREIATMKCLGATDGFIMINFILESIVQGIAGGVIGAVLGFLLGLLRSWGKFGLIVFRELPALDLLEAAGLSVAVGVAISALAAVYPAWVAARLAPMEAMRIE